MNPLSVSTIWLSYTLLFFGIFSYFSPKERLARALLFGSALSMAVGYAFSFDFLWPWDERFHALVAKNLVNHPFKPTLYNATPYQDFEHSFWNVSHVWLHKQPFFSWLMALSIKFFGPTSWSPRLPSVLLLALASMAALRIGSITLSKRAGLSAFLLVGFSPYLLGLISGEIKLDHNDSIFSSLVIFSLWAWVEYLSKPQKKWIIFTGIFCGLAILTKWLPGLLVFGGWGVHWLIYHRTAPRQLIPLAQAMVVAALVALPWQIYTFFQFPELARAEWHYNSAHLWEAVEGHGGPWWFHLKVALDHFGIILSSFFFMGIWHARKKTMYGPMLAMAVFVFLFFSAVATKMESFTLVGLLPVVWFMAAGMDWLLGFAERWPIPSSKFIPPAIGLCLVAVWTQPLHHLEKSNPQDPAHVPYHGFTVNRHHYEQWNSLPTGIIFNLKRNLSIDCMYYTDHVAYEGYPKESALKGLQSLGMPIYLCTYPNEAPPAYLRELDWVIWIEGPTYNYG